MQTLARVFLAALLFASAAANAANPGTLLVLNKSDNTVSLLDLATKKSVATIPTGPVRTKSLCLPTGVPLLSATTDHSPSRARRSP